MPASASRVGSTRPSPAAPEIVTVSYPGIEAFEAKPLDIGSYCDKTPTLPLSMQEAEVKTSRLLDALKNRRDENRQMKTDAISFSSYGKEVADV